MSVVHSNLRGSPFNSKGLPGQAGALDELSTLRQESLARGKYQLSLYDDDDRILQDFEIKAGPGGYHFLVWRDSGDEVLLDVQGFVGESLLPPLPKHIRCVIEGVLFLIAHIVMS